jgi:ParB family transcriptional regulator, chromosome partitioning protein
VARRSGLGKGLGALIPTDVADDGGSLLREVPVGQIQPNRRQPRAVFDEVSLGELTASIRQLGLLQPVLLREGDDGSYELIAGERRWRAAQQAGLATVPALIRSVDDASSLEQALVENLHRDDLNVLEEAAAYEQLMEEFGLTQDEVARRVGRSRSSVANTLRLLQLPPGVQALVVNRSISAGHARALLGETDAGAQEALANRIVAEGLTVRDVEGLVRGTASDSPSSNGKAAPTLATRSSSSDDRPAGLLELEQLLAERLETRVRVDLGAKKGRIEIEFADLEDLERIFLVMTTGEV